MAAVTITGGASSTAYVNIVANCGFVTEGTATLSGVGSISLNGILEQLVSTNLIGEASIKAIGVLENDHITIREVIDEILLLWGIESSSLAKEVVRNQAVNEINAALQLINSQAKELDYLNRTTRTYTLSEHTESVELQSDVQNVEGPVRWVRPGVVVSRISTSSPYKWTLDFSGVYGGYSQITFSAGGQSGVFSAYILDGSGNRAWPSGVSGEVVNDTARTDFKIDIPGLLAISEGLSTVSPGEVIISGSWPHYEFEYLGSAGPISLSASDNTLLKSKTNLRPLASRDQLDNYRNLFGSYQAGIPEYFFVNRTKNGSAENTNIKIEIRPQSDLGSGIGPGNLEVDVTVEPKHFFWEDYAKSTPIPLPHKYVESLFLPIVRYRATVSHYYVGTQGADALQANYQAALAQFGMIDPQIQEVEEIEQR